MRHWLLHPVVFYPIIAVVAALLIAISLAPQAWPRAAAPVAGEMQDGTLTLSGEALGAPEGDVRQELYVVRDFWGRASALRIAVLPSQPRPGPTDTGVRILLEPETAAQLTGPVRVEIRYNPLPINAATQIGVSLQGGGAPVSWLTAPLPEQSGVVTMELPARPGADALGLRAVSDGTDQAYGVEITRIRITPLRS